MMKNYEIQINQNELQINQNSKTDTDSKLMTRQRHVCIHVLHVGVKKNSCYFSSLITFYYIHES